MVNNHLQGRKVLKCSFSFPLYKREMPNGGAMIGKIVAQMPEALGLLGAGSLTPAVRELKLDKVDVITLYYVTKGEPSASAKKLIDATTKFAGK